MDSFSKEKKDEMATSFAILALYDGGAEISSEKVNDLLEATGNTEVEAFYPIIFSTFLSDPAKVAELLCSPGGGAAAGGGAGGDGGDDAAEEEEKEEVVEEEMDIGGGGMDMFGGDDAGDY